MSFLSFIKQLFENKSCSENVCSSDISSEEVPCDVDEKIEVNPEFEFDSVCDYVKYDLNTTECKIGQLLVFYSIPDNCPSLSDKKCDISVILKNGNNSIIADSVFLKGQDNSKDNCISITLKAQSLNNNKEESPAYTIDVFVDLSKLPKQTIEKVDYKIEISGIAYCGSDIPKNLSPCCVSIPVVKNIQKSEIEFILEDNDNGKVMHLHNNQPNQLPIIKFEIGGSWIKSYTLFIGNKAKEINIENACIIVDKINVSENINGAVLLDSNNESISNVFNVTINNKSRITILDGSQERIPILFEFNPRNISYVSANKDSFTVNVVLRFVYWENIDGDKIELFESKKKDCTLLIDWYFEVLPSGKWLCVDYGSSAIVCKYGDDILDIRAEKTNVLQSDDNLRNYLQDETEQGTQFLSSEIILNLPPFNHPENESSLCSEQIHRMPYSSQAVLLSPTSSLIEDNDTTPLPCLKLLVGNEFLPNYSKYLYFEYYCKDSNNGVSRVQANSIKNSDNCILRINTILSESYQVLFKYFINPVVNRINASNHGVDQLVLTYPNTYSPNHLKILEKAVRKVLPGLRYLQFVSESDAVAAYYVHNWPDYHIGDVDNEYTKEYVLVYDMGAGTLDLTYFLVDHSNQNIEILGRIGSEKAGNYIDNVIAEIICKLLRIDDSMYQTTPPESESIVAKRMNFKHIIQHHIKPRLSHNQSIDFTFDGVNYSIEPSRIKSDELFVSCMSDCTSTIISKFCAYAGYQRPPINTVIMSGRSCMLIPLRESLQKSIIEIARIGITPKFFPSYNQNIDSKLQKTIVSDGAVIIANHTLSNVETGLINSHRFYASFGIIFKNNANQIDYVELLNYKDSPIITRDMEVFYSESKRIRVNQGSTIILIQTYLNPHDTLKSYKMRDMEYLSIMNSYNTAELGRDIELRLKVDSLNNVTLISSNGHTVGMPPLGIDLTNDVTKKSLWPIVFN